MINILKNININFSRIAFEVEFPTLLITNEKILDSIPDDKTFKAYF